MNSLNLLGDVKVLDLTYYASGPIAAMVLGDLGADVIKVEPPGGEPARYIGVTFPGGWSTFFLATNRNKRSLCIDYRTPAGQDVIRRIASDCDVFLENSRPGTWEKYGLDADKIQALNPQIIYASISGFGKQGPMRDWIAMDPIAQAVGGLMTVTGSSDSGPVKVGAAVADVTAGRLLAFGVVAALYERERTGKGRRISTSLLDTVVSMLSMREVEYQFTGSEPELLGTAHGQVVPGQAFVAKDGQRVMMTMYTDSHFRLWCELMGREDIAEDSRFASNESRRQHMTECVDAVQAVVGSHTTEELAERLAGRIPFGPIVTFSDLWEHPQLESNDMFVRFNQPEVGPVLTVGSPVHFDNQQIGIRHGPPELGAHSRDILKEAGLKAQEIDELVAEGVLIVPESNESPTNEDLT